MSLLTRVVACVVYDRIRFFSFILFRCGGFLPDKLYLSLLYWSKMGRRMDWGHPRTFTEKIQWLKVYDFKSWYTQLVDKLTVKEYVASKIGREYVIPTIAVWDSVEDIDWGTLPTEFVLKTTHGGGGGGVVICRNKNTLDRKNVVEKLRQAMHSDIGRGYREKPYLKVPKKIIAEELMEPHDDKLDVVKKGLLDYKFFCFNGKCKCFKVDFGRFVEHHANYYSTDGALLPFGEKSFEPDPLHEVQLPDNLDNMIAIAERLATGFRFLRVDLYNVSGKIYFGELTFYPASGMGLFVPEEWDYKLGEYLNLD